MDTLSIRDLRNRPGAVQADLSKKGELLLTSNGRPVALMLPVDGSNLDETLQAIRLARGQLALRALRRQAREHGASELSQADIDAEIAAARKVRS
ncbi:MAG: type II toxin-antitoxin system Phd/YefM family antitoxin [Burkholderiaceae bacterium]|jgi:antitoxin (DNA-binding transcriptional repressor) of toxin-antitoxin stability system|nr:type II toxin-antitoxin system Phd/YefM family antitoxin [Burkholderiaceae bacterium]MCZ7559500.1 type II toxin-antitoxin system Phd/YefM family antitoxin [Burkholderiaceae bacterium]